MFTRIHLQILQKRMLEPRAFIQILSGPHQVGKTTIVKQMLANTKSPYLFISADEQHNSNTAWINQQWETARLKFQTSGASDFLFIIDEIQKIPNWSETVKANWDADTFKDLPIKVILLGSSRLLLQDGLTESLAGRYEVTYMPHWSLAEMETAFGLTPNQFAWFGGYPGAARLLDDELRWKKYISDALIEPSISRDILSLSRVEKPALLRRLFEFGCLYSGQILSYTKMIGQLQDVGNTTTLAFYLKLLDSAGLIGGLEKYAGDIIRERQSSPKFQVHNTAFISALHAATFSEILTLPDEWGRIVESAVGAHLVNHARQDGFSVNYWRDGNDEVDFVLENRGKTVAIEVKSSRARSTSGMSAFQRKHNPDKLLLVGPTGLPWEDFLKINPLSLF
jgi:uncharacterized protein